MALLDPIDRVLDVVLTDYGRKLLSQNRLNFTYYAFSDEGIDYSGSLALTSFSSSIDNIIFRNFSFEETQREDSDLRYFLYTIPAKSLKIPQLIANPTTGSTITLNRNFYQQDFSLINSDLTFNARPLDVVFRATIHNAKKDSEYVKYQNFIKILSGNF